MKISQPHQPQLIRRKGGPLGSLIADFLSFSLRYRSWAVLVVALLTAAAIVLGAAGQNAVPFVVYGGA